MSYQSPYFLSNFTSNSNIITSNDTQTGVFPTYTEQNFASTTSQNLALTPSEILNLDLSSLRASYTQLAADYNRLKSSNNMLNQEVLDYRKRNMDLERTYSQEVENMIAERERSLRSQETEKRASMGIGSQFQVANQELAAENEKLISQNDQLSSKCALLSIEIDRLNSILQDKNSEISQLQQQLKQKGNSDSELRAQQSLIQDYEKRIASLLKENNSFVDRLKLLEGSSSHVQHLRSQLQEAETIIFTLRSENEQLSHALKEKVSQEGIYRSQNYEHRIQDLQNQVSQLSLELQRKQDLESAKAREYEITLQTLQQKLDRTLREKDFLDGENKRLSELLKDNEGSNKRVGDYEKRIHELNDEINLWKRKCESLDIQKEEEIRRIRLEIERSIKIQYDEEFRIRGQGFDKERLEYETVIKSFREKFHEFERNLHLLAHENERLKALLADKDREIDSLKRNDDDQKEIDKLRTKLLEAQQSAEADRAELFKRVQEAEAKIMLQITELSRLSNVLLQKDAEIEQWRKKYMALEQSSQIYIEKTLADIEIQFKERLTQEKESYYATILLEKQQIEKQITTYSAKTKEYEFEIHRLININDRLTSQAEEMNIEIRGLKAKIETLLKERDYQLQQLRIQLEEEKKLQIQREVNLIELRFKERVESYEEEIKNLRLKIQDFELRQVLFFIEIERLYAINSEFIRDLNRLSDDNQQYSQENADLHRTIMELNQTVTLLREERGRLETLATDLASQIESYERRIQLLLNENYRLSEASAARLKEIDELKHNFSTRLVPTDANQSREFETLKRSHANMREVIVMFENEKKNLESQLNQLKNIIEMNRLEIIRLQESNQQRTLENESLQTELTQLKGASQTIMQLQADLRLKTHQYEQSLKEVDEMRRTRDFFKEQLDQSSTKPRSSVSDILKNYLIPTEVNEQIYRTTSTTYSPKT